MNTNLHFSAQTCLHATPDYLFEEINKEFSFTLDACAIAENAKVQRFFSPDDDGLLQPWSGTVWVNPPYGNQIEKWVAKAYRESFNGVTTVLLLPVRTDVKWFHNWILGKAEIRFIKGRLKFGGIKHNAPFPSMLVIYRPK